MISELYQVDKNGAYYGTLVVIDGRVQSQSYCLRPYWNRPIREIKTVFGDSEGLVLTLKKSIDTAPFPLSDLRAGDA